MHLLATLGLQNKLQRQFANDWFSHSAALSKLTVNAILSFIWGAKLIFYCFNKCSCDEDLMFLALLFTPFAHYNHKCKSNLLRYCVIPNTAL